jgi:hypothetical protein
LQYLQREKIRLTHKLKELEARSHRSKRKRKSAGPRPGKTGPRGGARRGTPSKRKRPGKR